MDLGILPLEERIVLDATGAVEIETGLVLAHDEVRNLRDTVEENVETEAETAAAAALGQVHAVLAAGGAAPQSVYVETSSAPAIESREDDVAAWHDREGRFADDRLEVYWQGVGALLDDEGRLGLLARSREGKA